MYPKDIAELLNTQGLGCKAVHNLNAALGEVTGNDLRRETWLIENRNQHPGIERYFAFLKACKERFSAVAKSMGYWNKASSHSLGHDKWSVGWGGEALLPIAHYLYCLKSYGLSGNILECGAFKGSSTACLSIACRLIGSKLYCADSFEGLPEDEAHYRKGDFIGTLDEVKRNVARWGEIESTTFIPGWYRESLEGFAQPLSILWIDVDLCSSTLDVLNRVYPALEKNAVIFSDGFQVGVDYEGTRVKQIGHDHPGLCEPAGIYQFFEGRKTDYQALPAGPPGLALIVPEINESTPPSYHAEGLSALLQAL